METLTRKYKAATFEPGALQRANDSIAAWLPGEGWSIRIIGEYATLGGQTARRSLAADDLEGITGLSDALRVLSFDCIQQDELKALVSLQGASHHVSLVTSSSDAAHCRELNELMVRGLSLEDVPDDFMGSSKTAPSARSPLPPTSTGGDPARSLGWVLQQMPAAGWIGLVVLLALAFLAGTVVGSG